MSDGAAARFFVDENDLALGRSLALAHKDVVHPGHPRLPDVPLGTPDAHWLPVVDGLDLVIITRDKRIRSRPIEAEAVITAGVRGFVLTSAGDLSTWQTLTLLVRQWDAMERFLLDSGSGPWLAAVTNRGIRPLSIRGASAEPR
jgi:hypothetical protein